MAESIRCQRLRNELKAIRAGLEEVMGLLSTPSEGGAYKPDAGKADNQPRLNFYDQITQPDELPEDGELFRRVLALITDMGYASTMVLQQKLEVNYRQAGSIITELERAGLVDSAHGLRPHKVLPAAYTVRELIEARQSSTANLLHNVVNRES